MDTSDGTARKPSMIPAYIAMMVMITATIGICRYSELAERRLREDTFRECMKSNRPVQECAPLLPDMCK